EIGKALFRGGFDATSMKTQGTGKLESLRTVEGRRAAKLVLKAQIQVAASEVLPAITLDLKGSALFLLDEGIFADCALEGPVRYELKKNDAGKETVFVSDERVAWKLHADPILAAPVKPVTKDDELAKAKGLGCTNGHRFPNGFAFCA